MRKKTDILPIEEETTYETKKRLRIIQEVKKEFEKFCEIMVVVGSVAFGKNYSIRKSSDIDILLLLKRKNAEKINECSLITMTPKYQEALNYFIKGEVDSFSINTEKIEGVEMQYHFWDKETHFKAETDTETKPKWYNVWRTDGLSIIKPLDLEGEERIIEIPPIKKGKYGIIQEFPPIHRVNGKVFLRQIINNLISDPDIIFCKDKQIHENIKKIWDFIAEEFQKEKISLNKENPLCFIIGNWSFSPDSYKRIKEEFMNALKRKNYSTSS